MSRISVYHPADQPIGFNSLIETGDALVDFLESQPNSTSDWHHHGEYDIFTYIISGSIQFEFGNGESLLAREGQLVHVPKKVKHRESNPTNILTKFLLIRVGKGRTFYQVDKAN